MDGGINLYAYVAGNPINLIDPFGLSNPLGIPFGCGIPGLDAEGRGFENAVRCMISATATEANKCLEATVTCTLKEIMPSIASDAIVKSALKRLAKEAALAGLKAGVGKIAKTMIPIYGPVSTGITVIKYADCFGSVYKRK